MFNSYLDMNIKNMLGAYNPGQNSLKIEDFLKVNGLAVARALNFKDSEVRITTERVIDRSEVVFVGSPKSPLTDAKSGNPVFTEFQVVIVFNTPIIMPVITG